MESDNNEAAALMGSATGRREFLKRGGALGSVLLTQFPAVISAQTATKAIKVGLVGCGGRGS